MTSRRGTSVPRGRSTGGGGSRRSTLATASAEVIGSSGYTSTSSAFDQVASQRSAARRTARMTGRDVRRLLVDLPANAHTAGWLGLTVEDRHVGGPAVDRHQHLGDGAALQEVDSGRCRAPDAARSPT